jgi:hypothetical protein
MHRGPLPACCCRHHRVDGLQRPSGRTASRGNTPSPITSPARRTARPRTEISPGARAHHTPPLHRAHDPPSPSPSQPNNTIARLTRNPGTDKQQRLDPSPSVRTPRRHGASPGTLPRARSWRIAADGSVHHRAPVRVRGELRTDQYVGRHPGDSEHESRIEGRLGREVQPRYRVDLPTFSTRLPPMRAARRSRTRISGPPRWPVLPIQPSGGRLARTITPDAIRELALTMIDAIASNPDTLPSVPRSDDRGVRESLLEARRPLRGQAPRRARRAEQDQLRQAWGELEATADRESTRAALVQMPSDEVAATIARLGALDLGVATYIEPA